MKTMTYREALKAVKKGKSVTRIFWKKGRLFSAKIVPLAKKKPYLWCKTGISSVFLWTPLDSPMTDIEDEHLNATDWIVCVRPG